ncbi:hypothetical protein LTR99_007029 [Exophiala xenobiotica]|uniref:C2H2-type domain-containing protein n=1 Tax=Vermiconidia calcicola TaxID=1690605 RepID=A0AAV9PSR7_9PEZI|nr:hypothetical protein LTR96_005291 [Exophiala xenobiotica]KAK5528823.1 hypothetical protein LTR25_010006 [Vermiconidia calcicola]KAK5539447.1 hypothetical protein LTR23_006467 [Chaetothyriales sp. CCFEE 6169]KAK5300282.1 hypothetical protein LTR99_007029 [Exophiala xenobiotica]KAK5334334.1 hypothetical protein LTR98_009799 [Exophiala xenobiotica]
MNKQFAKQPGSPSVRIQHSSQTPTPTPATQPPMLAQSPLVGGWNDGYHTGGYLSALPKNFRDQKFHKRGSSGSSVASLGPPSPLTHNNIYPHIVATTDSNFPSSYDFDHFQTPQTAKSDSAMMYPQNFGAVDMRRIQSQGADERASYNLSAPQSVSTMSHNSPATPHTNYEPEYDEKHVYGEHALEEGTMFEYLQFQAGYPTAAYQQSLQDVFPDQQFAMTYPQAQQNMQRMNLSSHRQNMMADRLQAATQDHLRTNSPTSDPRDKSPFRQNSPYGMPAPAQRPRQPPVLQKERTSISPKELMLDEHDVDDHAAPLFAPDQSSAMFGNRGTPSNLATFYTPVMTNESSMQIPQQYPFVGQSGQQSAGLPDVTPEFPAHMLSMESTNEEGPSEPSSQQSQKVRVQAQPRPALLQQQQQQPQPVQRPEDTSSDSGTYSCTYHGCHLRFETPAKLQKHKRDGHRQTSPVASASPNLALRNSQAGPHRCDRINPSTGKPCNSVFSRPYDLTRHEDTIHNGRKQKVRCHLCTEEKTFSRNDALTRHMRVVHPDVDWVGKQKRKSQK